jgi:hypothetical protein
MSVGVMPIPEPKLVSEQLRSTGAMSNHIFQDIEQGGSLDSSGQCSSTIINFQHNLCQHTLS